jgi:hypothetical protein
MSFKISFVIKDSKHAQLAMNRLSNWNNITGLKMEDVEGGKNCYQCEVREPGKELKCADCPVWINKSLPERKNKRQ